MATNPTKNLGMQNWFSTTLSQSCGSTDTTLYVANTPSVTEGYLIIDPNNTSTREVVHFTSLGSGTVILPSTGDRGLDGTSAQSHAQGTSVVLNYTTSYFTAIQNGYSLAPGAIATTALFSSSLYLNAVTSLANLGSAGGTIWYTNQGGVKTAWGQTGVISVSGNSFQNSAVETILFPNGFFTNVQNVQLSTYAVSGGYFLAFTNIAQSTATLSVSLVQNSGTGGASILQWYAIGN